MAEKAQIMIFDHPTHAAEGEAVLIQFKVKNVGDVDGWIIADLGWGPPEALSWVSRNTFVAAGSFASWTNEVTMPAHDLHLELWASSSASLPGVFEDSRKGTITLGAAPPPEPKATIVSLEVPETVDFNEIYGISFIIRNDGEGGTMWLEYYIDEVLMWDTAFWRNPGLVFEYSAKERTMPDHDVTITLKAGHDGELDSELSKTIKVVAIEDPKATITSLEVPETVAFYEIYGISFSIRNEGKRESIWFAVYLNDVLDYQGSITLNPGESWSKSPYLTRMPDRDVTVTLKAGHDSKPDSELSKTITLVAPPPTGVPKATAVSLEVPVSTPTNELFDISFSFRNDGGRGDIWFKVYLNDVLDYGDTLELNPGSVWEYSYDRWMPDRNVTVTLKVGHNTEPDSHISKVIKVGPYIPPTPTEEKEGKVNWPLVVAGLTVAAVGTAIAVRRSRS